MFRLLAATTACALVLTPASAQERPTLWDIFSPNRFVQGLLQSGIGMIRTQMDLKYGDLSVDLMRSRATITDVRAWPFFDWDESGDCQIDIARLTLLLTPIDTIDHYRLKVRVSGLNIPATCLPPEPRFALEVAKLDAVTVPRLTLDLEYGMPNSDAQLRLYADVTDVAALDLSADLAYVWFDGRDDMDDPEPVVFLDNATLSIENKGLWDSLELVVGSAFTGEDAAAVVETMLTEGLGEMNFGAGPDGAGLSDEQLAFIDSAVAAWPAFLANPERLVVETAIDGDVYLDFYAMEDDPREVFALLKPRVSLAPARVSDVVATDLLIRATGEGALSDDEKRRVGEALITGRGAPRNTAAGMALLEGLATAGDGDAALLVAEALENRQPDQAYLWALRAGATGATGASAKLDRLEERLPFAQVLDLQAEVSGGQSQPGAALASIAGMREQAAMRLSGDGLARSYGIALMWATLATAAGDPEGADMLDEIDEMVRLAGTEAQAAWAETETDFTDLAMKVWVEQDLPSRLAQ